jgi:hypothetical protein
MLWNSAFPEYFLFIWLFHKLPLMETKCSSLSIQEIDIEFPPSQFSAVKILTTDFRKMHMNKVTSYMLGFSTTSYFTYCKHGSKEFLTELPDSGGNAACVFYLFI